jgi:glycosyltransferase XagB
LPVLPSDVVDDVFSRMTAAETRDALRYKLVPTAWLPNAIYYASAGDGAALEAELRNVKLVGEVAAHDYRRAVKHQLGPKLVLQATYFLARYFPHFSASERLTPVQSASAVLIVVVLACSGLLVPHPFLVATSLLFSCFFLSLIALRVMCLLPQDGSPYRPRAELQDCELPVYSILVPLFRETRVLQQLVSGLNAIAYPPEKTDIKLVLEEEDVVMQRALARMVLPPQFEIIVVPAGKPQTKPRALNYALNFARGSLLTIYDAEDVPDPAQLRIAAETFAAAPPELACLQARLTFFNADESWLTRQFAVEYASLFAILLPTLAQEELPLPLGGTSNHFRMSVLERVGGWDPFNVTEDADLGMRLARAGYITGTIDSDTLEEANNDPVSWVKQRSRWLKGFLQTWLVHMRQPLVTLRDLGTGGFWVFQAVTMGVFLSALLHPIFLAQAIYILFSGNFLDTNSLLSTALAGLNMAVLIPGYGVSMLMGKRALEQRGIANWKFTIATLPFYWFMMMPAAWLALWDFIVKPFHWRKTQHGHAKTTAKSKVIVFPEPGSGLAQE